MLAPMTRRQLGPKDLFEHIGLRAVGVLTLIAMATTGCDSDETNTTGTVSELPSGRLCIAPEDPKQTDLIGCYPVKDGDVQDVKVGDCVAVRLPDYFVAENSNEPLVYVRKLSRPCR